MLKKIILLTTLLLSACSSKQLNLKTIPELDLSKYSGCWYEIATIPMFVQKGCVGTTATYVPKPDGKLRVFNRCYSEELTGAMREVQGDAYVVNASEPAKLRIDFDTWWGVFAKGHYWVIKLDPDYQWSVVTGPNPKRLWIMSKSPVMDEKLYSEIISYLKDLGFDISLIEKTKQFPDNNLCEMKNS